MKKMDRKSILIYTGIIIGAFVVITIVTYFLYPYLNEERYEQIVANAQQNIPIADTDLEYISSEFDHLNNELEQLREEERRLIAIIDSLSAIHEHLVADGDIQTALRENIPAQTSPSVIPPQARPAANEPDADLLAANELNEEEFSERVKSLLNLDEHELAPIVNQMTQQELVRLYKGGGNIQREKLLRSLDPKQAAQLMKEIML